MAEPGDDILFVRALVQLVARPMCPCHYPSRVTCGNDAIAPQGTYEGIVVFVGTLWHRGGANRSESQRLALSMQYCEPWARQQENFFLAIPKDIAKTMPPRVQELLGYSIWPAFMGMVTAHHPARVFDDDFAIPVAVEPRS